MPSDSLTLEDGGRASPTSPAHGQAHSLPTSMQFSTGAVATDRRGSLLHPKLPANMSFLPSSSQPSSLATTGHSKAAGRLSDAFANLSGRGRTLSSNSNSQNASIARAKSNGNAENLEGSSFGIDADPFASHYNASSSSTTIPNSVPSLSDRSGANPPNGSAKKQRGSLLIAASDALGFGRGLGVSFSRKIGRRNSVDQAPPLSHPQSQQNQLQRKGLPWKGKSKMKGHWALQPPSTSHIISDVIEISAANGARISVRDSEEENERKERERLREAAAESIGISPLMRESASSRLGGNDSMRFEDESYEEINLRDGRGESLDVDPSEETPDMSRSIASGTIKPKGLSGGLQLQLLQSRESRHHRNSSLSGAMTPTTATSAHWPLATPSGQSATSNGLEQPARSFSPSTVQRYLPAFPCLYGSLEPFTKKTSAVLKHFPSSPLLLLGLSRQWRTRFMVMSAPHPSRPTSPNGIQSSTPENKPTICHLHLFKSAAADERELERLEINEDSVVFVAEEEISGRRSVVKVGGVDVGGRKKELNAEENGQTMWFLSIANSNEAQSWITVLKDAVLDQMAERAGFGMATHSLNTAGPKGDLDVMLSMRAQDVATSIRSQGRPPDHYTDARTSSSSVTQDFSPRRTTDSSSPSPTVRSWTGDGRPSPSVRMMSLKGLFSVPGRARSSSRGSTRSEDSPNTPGGTASFSSRGNTLLNMLRTPSVTSAPEVNSAETDSSTTLTRPVTVLRALPGPILSTVPILSSAEMNFDRPTPSRERELPAWYSIQSRQHNRGDSSSSLNTSPALLPPPRNRRPWTSSGVLGAKQERPTESGYPSRKSFQDSASFIGGRLSLDNERTRPHSPVDSLGTATGVFGTSELRPGRTSMSSSVSSFISAPAERDQLVGRSVSGAQRRARTGKIPKMQVPPAGPPPSIPAVQSAQKNGSSTSLVADLPGHPFSGDRPPSRASSIRSVNNSEVTQNGISSNRRLSTSSALSVGSATSLPQSRITHFHGIRRLSSSTAPPKRQSMPPPPRPAPTTALPPTPSQSAPLVKHEQASPRKSSFRESFSHRSLKFSLSPPPLKALPPRPDDGAATIGGHRRTFSNGSASSDGPSFRVTPPSPIPVSPAPRAPPPTGPLPPTPQDQASTPRHSSFRERLRMKSAPSSPPSSILRGASAPPPAFPGSTPLVTVSSVASLKDVRYPIGEPITAISHDFNFLNMSPLDTASTVINDDADFLNMSSPLTSSSPMQIPRGTSDRLPLLADRTDGSPPTIEMTVLPPPPRRSRMSVVQDKDKEYIAISPTNPRTSAVVDDSVDHETMPSISLETIATV